MHIAANMQVVVDDIKKSKQERYNYMKTCLSREVDRQKAFQSDLHKARVIWQSLLKLKERKQRK